MDDLPANLEPGTMDDAALLDAARCASASPETLRAWRERWPTHRLPIVDDYYCTERLGEGATGVVYKAVDMSDEPAFVAIKLLQFGSEEAESRFREREVEILRRLDCPHVARYLDSGTAGGQPYLVMQLVEGTPLDEYFSANPMTLE